MKKDMNPPPCSIHPLLLSISENKIRIKKGENGQPPKTMVGNQ